MLSKYIPYISSCYTVPLFFLSAILIRIRSEQHLDSFQQEWNRAMISFTGNTCVNPPNSGQTGCCENGLDRYCSYGYLAKYHVLNG